MFGLVFRLAFTSARFTAVIRSVASARAWAACERHHILKPLGHHDGNPVGTIVTRN
jgi:hypothetical protein